MIAIDSNVLLRYVLGDDELQARKATRSIQGGDLVFISQVVLAETAWTLVGKKYRASAKDIADVILALFEEESVVLQDAHVAWSALVDFRMLAVEQGIGIDFPDTLIYHCGIDAAEYYEERFDGFHTFDKSAQRLPEAISPS